MQALKLIHLLVIKTLSEMVSVKGRLSKGPKTQRKGCGTPNYTRTRLIIVATCLIQRVCTAKICHASFFFNQNIDDNTV